MASSYEREKDREVPHLPQPRVNGRIPVTDDIAVLHVSSDFSFPPFGKNDCEYRKRRILEDFPEVFPNANISHMPLRFSPCQENSTRMVPEDLQGRIPILDGYVARTCAAKHPRVSTGAEKQWNEQNKPGSAHQDRSTSEYHR
mmetsp:Transcript_6932/g.14346  ORF Transcript_6932/g.14346 Transcript_6932/m.14346 type:complete len:143 (+) Transcript_6932:3701-4129(+)